MLTDLGKRGQNQRPLLEAQEDGEPVSSLPINTARRMQHRAEYVYQIQVDSVAEHSATSSQAYATWPQHNAFRVWGGHCRKLRQYLGDARYAYVQACL